VLPLSITCVIASKYKDSQRCPDAICKEVHQVARASDEKELVNLVSAPDENRHSGGQQSCASAERAIKQPSEQREHGHVSQLVPRLWNQP
jgi:hypothetical protein